jgi:hypothetical protein
MTRVDVFQTISPPVASPVETGAATDELLSRCEPDEERLAWDEVIDYRLIEWGRDPSQLDDENFQAPSLEIISLACRVAREMRAAGLPAPLRVVPNGDGGITFEHKAGRVFETIEIDEDGSIELVTFADSKLVFRQRFEFQPSQLDAAD